MTAWPHVDAATAKARANETGHPVLTVGGTDFELIPASGELVTYLRDGDPQPGRYARNGRRRGLLGRNFGPPRDEGAWARRLREIRDEREEQA